MALSPMTPSYQLDRFTSNGERSSFELAGAMVISSFDARHDDPFTTKDDFLFVQAEIKGPKQKNPASNLRFSDKEVNNLVVKNTYNLFMKYKELNEHPIIITSYPRNERTQSFKVEDDGTFTVIYNLHTSQTFTKQNLTMESFLRSFDITPSMMLNMRESSKSAKYNTYFADILSFILKVDYFAHPEMFDEVTLTPEILHSDDERFKDVKDWKPKDGFDYLYYTDNPGPASQKFMIPKKDSIQKVYYQMWEILSNQENGIKSLVRDYFKHVMVDLRWSDYWKNDIDDFFTILAIINCYKHTTLTQQETNILKQFEAIQKQFLENDHSMEPEPEY